MENSFPEPKKPEASAKRVEGREGKKSSVEQLNEVMARMAQEVNTTVEGMYGVKNLVNNKACIDAEGFAQEKGGIYNAEEITEDQEIVDSLNRHYSWADDLDVRKHYGIDTAKGMVERYLKEKEANKSNQAEMAITALLHKILKERFIVVRASTFDDYKHGMDNLILDRETGAVICAFDEVLRNEGDAKKAPVKLEKIKKAALKGGNEAKYGIALKDGVLVRSRLRNVPVFYLSLESRDLNALTNDLATNYDKDATALEQSLFNHLVSSISDQKAILESLPLPQVMKNKLKAFEESLQVLKGYGERK